jgi:putative transposase
MIRGYREQKVSSSKLLTYDADSNAYRNFLKKLEKFDLTSGVGKPVRLRIFYRLKSSSAVLVYGRIGRSRGSVNLPVVILTYNEKIHHSLYYI